jgi:hypothetical protein
MPTQLTKGYVSFLFSAWGYERRKRLGTAVFDNTSSSEKVIRAIQINRDTAYFIASLPSLVILFRLPLYDVTFYLFYKSLLR